ncbi:AraC family transcriptional regulator [Flavobacterium sp. 245]|uniref:AraC family transcriptional regulator n=1 Tax=Flavobacterium sp. 245 TaxID=2512115 RepID=UPI00105D5C28|nr:helix-turn-helix transcriptional regulator [Flavobacterium sp. 245]TDO97119.1 AraC-like DNA-binding protein [Flavobacterium sp. 245]
MSAKKTDQNIPLLGLREFRTNQDRDSDQLIFNELHGERHIHKPHQHDFFIIVLFDQAKGVHNIDFIDYKISNKQIHLLFPGQVHKWNIEPDTTGYQLMIDRDFFESFSSSFRFSFAQYHNHPVIPLNQESYNLLQYEFLAIKNELESTDFLQKLISYRTAVIASIISKEAAKIFADHDIYQSEPRIAKFQELIDIYFKEEKLVSFYASKLHVSANYLNILCRKYLKISATQLIQQRIILESKRHLKATTLSVKEIAFELGFVDHAYFSNFFKNQTGNTPTNFREQL